MAQASSDLTYGAMQAARIGRAERAAAEHVKRRIAEPQLRCVTAQDDIITITATQGLIGT
jgi:hypothetical protein